MFSPLSCVFCVSTALLQALFLIALQEVSLMCDAGLLPQSPGCHCCRLLRAWYFFSTGYRRRNHAALGPSSPSAQLMPSQQAKLQVLQVSVYISPHQLLLLRTTHCFCTEEAVVAPYRSTEHSVSQHMGQTC